MDKKEARTYVFLFLTLLATIYLERVVDIEINPICQAKIENLYIEQNQTCKPLEKANILQVIYQKANFSQFVCEKPEKFEDKKGCFCYNCYTNILPHLLSFSFYLIFSLFLSILIYNLIRRDNGLKEIIFYIYLALFPIALFWAIKIFQLAISVRPVICQYLSIFLIYWAIFIYIVKQLDGFPLIYNSMQSFWNWITRPMNPMPRFVYSFTPILIFSLSFLGNLFLRYIVLKERFYEFNPLINFIYGLPKTIVTFFVPLVIVSIWVGYFINRIVYKNIMLYTIFFWLFSLLFLYDFIRELIIVLF